MGQRNSETLWHFLNVVFNLWDFNITVHMKNLVQIKQSMLLKYMKCPFMKFRFWNCLNNLLTLLVFTAHFNKCLLKLTSYTFILTICIQISHYAVLAIQCLKINSYYIENILLTLLTRLWREPPDTMSLCYADIEPPRFARQTKPPLCR